MHNIPTRTPTETISLRLNRDASTIVTRFVTTRNMTGPEAASDLIMLGYATLMGDPDSVKILVRHLQTVGDQRHVATKLLSTRLPPAILPGHGKPPAPPKIPDAVVQPPKKPRPTNAPAAPLHVRTRKEK